MDLGGMRSPIVDVVEAVGRVNIRNFEELSSEELLAELVPKTGELVADAMAGIDAIAERSGALAASQTPGDLAGRGPASPAEGASEASSPAESFERTLDSLVDNAAPSAEGVDDIAFIARLELGERKRRLTALGAGRARIDVLGECERTLRGVRKSLSALDRAVSDAFGVPRLLHYESELETSLRVRQCYARFRQQILGDGEEVDELGKVRARLREAGTAIAVLIGRSIYPELRVRDRLQIRELQARILTWLRGAENDRASGIRLFEDLAAFARLLAEVNNREELLVHDAAVVTEAYDELFAGRAAPRDPIPPYLCARLQSLSGLDDEVDALLAAKPPWDRGHWERVLTRLRHRFATAGPS